MADSTRTIRIRSARLYDGSGAPALDDATVVVRGGVVDWVGADHEAPEPLGDETLVDAQGLSLMPGFIGSHVHLCAEPQRAVRPHGVDEGSWRCGC